MVAESFVIYIVAVVLVLIVLAVLIVTCFRQKDIQSTTETEGVRQRRYISRGGQVVLSELYFLEQRHCEETDSADKVVIFMNKC